MLCHGVKAKFDQNWSLQDPLIATRGKQLYEGTTDMYFACGLGFESKKWADRDWGGENVAGLILMKVREELTGQPPDHLQAETTLGEIAREENLNSSIAMDTQTKLSDESVLDADVSTSTIIDQTPSIMAPSTKNGDYPLDDQSLSTTHNSPVDSNVSVRKDTQTTNRRGRGRGRGRGQDGRGSQSQRNYPNTLKGPHDKMTATEWNFLCGNTPAVNKREQTVNSTAAIMTTTTTTMNWANALGLTEAQVKGLEMLGLVPKLRAGESSLTQPSKA